MGVGVLPWANVDGCQPECNLEKGTLRAPGQVGASQWVTYGQAWCGKSHRRRGEPPRRLD